MEFTEEERVVVLAYRQQKEAAEAALERQRRAQSIAATIAKLIEEAKVCLQDAKRIAVDNGFEYQIGDMVKAMIDDVSDNDQWYGSDQSHC